MVDTGSEAGLRLAAAIKEYARAVRAAARDGQVAPSALPSGHHVTPTEVMIAVDGLLRAADLEVFEVQIWRSLGRAGAVESGNRGPAGS